mmetsp:Transcript_31029/g.101629  ORF Transcript_31029/g.101629 Transcript_31029/m.101629 type:complete len:83 (-) Transcript_31029:165-413(-)
MLGSPRRPAVSQGRRAAGHGAAAPGELRVSFARGRPAPARVVESMPPGSRVAVGGPPAFVDALAAALKLQGRDPPTRLTQSM